MTHGARDEEAGEEVPDAVEGAADDGRELLGRSDGHRHDACRRQSVTSAADRPTSAATHGVEWNGE